MVEPQPPVKLWGFGASSSGAFVVIESDEQPPPDADRLSGPPQGAKGIEVVMVEGVAPFRSLLGMRADNARGASR